MNSVESLRRGLRILEIVAQDQPIGVTDLAKKIDLPKSTVQRLLTTLAQEGWIERANGELTRWRLVRRPLVPPTPTSAEIQLRDTAHPHIIELCHTTNETVHLAIRDGINGLILIDRADSDQDVRTWRPLGTVSPLHAASAGLAVLAHCTPVEIDEVIGRGLKKYMPSTITDPDELRAELAHIRQRGYSVTVCGLRPNVCAVGSAIFDRFKRPSAAACITMPDFRFKKSRLPSWGKLVHQTAATITANMEQFSD